MRPRGERAGRSAGAERTGEADRLLMTLIELEQLAGGSGCSISAPRGLQRPSGARWDPDRCCRPAEQAEEQHRGAHSEEPLLVEKRPLLVETSVLSSC